MQKIKKENKELFDKGYYDGLEFVLKALQRSKVYLMALVKDEIEN